MTRVEVAKIVAEKTGMPYIRAKEAVDEMLEAMAKLIVKQGRIELRKFGVFEVVTRKKRPARNPRTGEKVMIPKRKVITFKPSRLLTARVRRKRR